MGQNPSSIKKESIDLGTKTHCKIRFCKKDSSFLNNSFCSYSKTNKRTCKTI